MRGLTSIKLITLAVLIVRCEGPGQIKAPMRPAQGSASALTSIAINLPDRTPMRQAVPDIDQKLNGYRLVINPVDPACPDATRFDQTADYAVAGPVSASLRQGCDYDIWLALGHVQAAGSGPVTIQPLLVQTPTWQADIETIISTNCGGCHGSGSANGDFSNYAAAKTAGANLVTRTQNGSMPPRSPLAVADKDRLKAWADGGFLELPPPPQVPTVPTAGLDAIYFQSSTAARVARTEIDGVPTLRKPVEVALQQAGRELGLDRVSGLGGQPPVPVTTTAVGTGTDTGLLPPVVIPGTGDGTVIPPSVGTGTGIGTGTGVANPVTLPTEKDIELRDAAGNSTRLSQLFAGARFIALDFSSPSCGYCIDDARELNRDSSTQGYFTGGRCVYATIVGRDDLESWVSAIGGQSGFVGERSFEATTTNLGSIVQRLGADFGGTPTYVLLDSTGAVIRSLSGAGGLSELALDQNCR